MDWANRKHWNGTFWNQVLHNWLRVYSDQESPIVHLLGPNQMFFILVRFTFTLYILASGPKYVNKAKRSELVQLLVSNDTRNKHNPRKLTSQDSHGCFPCCYCFQYNQIYMSFPVFTVFTMLHLPYRCASDISTTTRKGTLTSEDSVDECTSCSDSSGSTSKT